MKGSSRQRKAQPAEPRGTIPKAESAKERRLFDQINSLFNRFLQDRRSQLGPELNNAVVDLRNLVTGSLRNILAEESFARMAGGPVDSLGLVAFSQCKACPPRECVSPPVPADIEEARELEMLLPRIAEYREKLRVLSDELRPIAEQLGKVHGYWYWPDVERLVYRAFYRELENRPYQQGRITKIWASTKTEGVIRNRNLPCEICGENRRTDKCHIIPRALGGTLMDGNILTLCPTHHALLDSHMLSEDEWNRIDWTRKCEVSQKWARKLLLANHTEFWRNDLPSRPQSAIDFGDHRPFARELARQLVLLLGSKGEVLQRDIYGHFDPNVRLYMRKVLKALMDARMIMRRSARGTYLLFLEKPPTALLDAIENVHFRF